MKTALNDAKRERREAVEALVYEKAASARMREIALRSKLGESRAEWKRSLESNPVEITAGHIQEVITAMTGIPAERVSGGEMSRLQTLREHLAKRVVGQQEAVEKISRTIRRSRAGLKDETAPSASSSSSAPRASARRCWPRRCRNGCSTSAAG